MIKQQPVRLFSLLLLIILSITACNSQTKSIDEETYNPALNPADFAMVVDNPYFPLVQGTKWVYEGETEEGFEHIEVEVLAETRQVIGITTTIVRDTVYLDGEMVEDTLDWYAQDKNGDVWYLGEDVNNYQNGKLANKSGSWEAGVDGALPGIIMFEDLAAHLGEIYRQEYYKGKAEDFGELLSVSENVDIPFGSFEDVVQTKDYTPLEPDQLEHKFYAAGIGMVKEIDVEAGYEILLVEFLPSNE